MSNSYKLFKNYKIKYIISSFEKTLFTYLPIYGIQTLIFKNQFWRKNTLIEGGGVVA